MRMLFRFRTVSLSVVMLCGCISPTVKMVRVPAARAVGGDTVTISGRVTDENGVGIPGVVIHATEIDYDHDGDCDLHDYYLFNGDLFDLSVFINHLHGPEQDWRHGDG